MESAMERQDKFLANPTWNRAYQTYQNRIGETRRLQEDIGFIVFC